MKHILTLVLILVFVYFLADMKYRIKMRSANIIENFYSKLPSSWILPYKFGQDTEFKKPIRNNVKYYTVKKELSPKKIEQIIENIKESHKMSPELEQNLNLVKTQQPKVLKEYKLMRDYLIGLISEKGKEFDDPYYVERNFKYLNENILSYRVDKYKNIEQVEFNIRIYRNNKNKHFVIYTVMLIDLETMTYYIRELSLLSTNIEENVVFNREKEFISTNSNQCATNDRNCDNKLSETKITDILKERSDLLKEDQINRLNKCFYKEAEDRLGCISYDKEKDIIGLWDQPCVYDEECPFFKKNKNYPNSRGGCLNGYCEMPLNVKNQGYRYKGPEKPICHNCPKKENCVGLRCSMCCDEQELPDFAFTSDYKKRQEHLDELNSRGLSVFDIRII
jgi:hypothetical protein